MVVDSTGTTLGQVVDAFDDTVSVLTSSGHLVTLRWDGTYEPSPVAFLMASCAGTAYLSSRATDARSVFARRVVYSPLKGLLYVPAATSSASLAHASVDSNGTCRPSSATVQAWALTSIAPGAAGLPGTIVGPLSLQ